MAIIAAAAVAATILNRFVRLMTVLSSGDGCRGGGTTGVGVRRCSAGRREWAGVERDGMARAARGRRPSWKHQMGTTINGPPRRPVESSEAVRRTVHVFVEIFRYFGPKITDVLRERQHFDTRDY
ncbi:hypothetical protein Misp05_15780 [Micromonospora sp. NBRC 107095]|nr:hypothetical protein Misp05_15780 [Micromonospora sp. NBRC 107095]